MDLHADDDFPIACRAFDELLRVDRSVHEPCAFNLLYFLPGVRAALEPVNPFQDERAFRVMTQSLRSEIIYAQFSEIIATLR
jgi:hypothetical protein